MRFLLTALLVFGIFAGISSAFRGPYWGWHGYYGRGYYGGPCGGWYYQPGPPPAAPGAPPSAAPGAPPATPQ